MKLIRPKYLEGEDGLSVVAGLALLATAGLLIILGIYVRHHQAKSTSSSTAKTVSLPSNSPASQPSSGSATKTVPDSQKSTTGSVSASSSSPQPVNHNVIVIGALGAKITVPDSIKDLTYYVATNSGGHVVVNFSTHSLSSAVPACAANQGTGAFDSIERGNGQYSGQSSTSSGALLKQYPSYYLAYILPRGPCAKGLPPDDQNLIDTQSQDFYTALSTVQATQ